LSETEILYLRLTNYYCLCNSIVYIASPLAPYFPQQSTPSLVRVSLTHLPFTPLFLLYRLYCRSLHLYRLHVSVLHLFTTTISTLTFYGTTTWMAQKSGWVRRLRGERPCNPTVRSRCQGNYSSVENGNISPPIEIDAAFRKTEAYENYNQCDGKSTVETGARNVAIVRSEELGLNLYFAHHAGCRHLIR